MVKLILLALLALPLAANGLAGRLGVEAGAFQPSGRWARDYSDTPETSPPTGLALGLALYVNPGGRHQGRVRVGYLETGKAPEAQVSYAAPQPLPAGQMMLGRPTWRAWTMGDDWLPHFSAGASGPFGILGAHGERWERTSAGRHAVARDPLAPPIFATHAGYLLAPGFLAVLGLGYRFNRHSTLELRSLRTLSTMSADAGGAGLLLVATLQF
jgi:hypothetical protein